MSTIVTITGLDVALRDVRATRAELLPALGRALYEEAEAPFERSQELVPVDTEALKNSGRRHRPVIEGNGVGVELSYGGPGLDYTETVHEDLSMRHAPPTQAKFLETAVLEAIAGMGERVGVRVACAIGRGLMLLHDVAAVLVEARQGTLGDDLFLSALPDSPDAAVALYEYPGLAPAYIYGQLDPVEEYPRCQLQVRDVDYDAARLRIERCARALGRVREWVIDGTHYHRISPLGTVAVLEGGESGRVRLALSFEACKALSPLVV